MFCKHIAATTQTKGMFDNVFVGAYGNHSSVAGMIIIFVIISVGVSAKKKESSIETYSIVHQQCLNIA